jgi:hypothetical protein
MKVFAFTVTRATSDHRVKQLQNTLVEARRTAGMDFHWHVVGSGCGANGQAAIKLAFSTAQIQSCSINDSNIGQHVAWNEAFAAAVAGGYKYFLRLDDDCEFVSKRWLKKMVEFCEADSIPFCVSPTIRGLIRPPETSQQVNVRGIPVEFLFGAIGGICRLHTIAAFEDYIADVRKPLGSGDATGVAHYCREKKIFMAYLKHIRVRHATRKQEAQDPEHFLQHGVFQHIPYIPRSTNASSERSPEV